LNSNSLIIQLEKGKKWTGQKKREERGSDRVDSKKEFGARGSLVIWHKKGRGDDKPYGSSSKKRKEKEKGF